MDGWILMMILMIMVKSNDDKDVRDVPGSDATRNILKALDCPIWFGGGASASSIPRLTMQESVSKKHQTGGDSSSHHSIIILFILF